MNRTSKLGLLALLLAPKQPQTLANSKHIDYFCTVKQKRPFRMAEDIGNMTIEEILTRKEDQTFDCKSIQIAPKSLAIPIVAFANADGGVIAIGISDKTRKIEDITVPKFIESTEKVAEKVAENKDEGTKKNSWNKRVN